MTKEKIKFFIYVSFYQSVQVILSYGARLRTPYAMELFQKKCIQVLNYSVRLNEYGEKQSVMIKKRILTFIFWQVLFCAHVYMFVYVLDVHLTASSGN